MDWEWEVYLKDSLTMNSKDHKWEDIPNNTILVLRWWGPSGKGINWGDSLYGHPSTLKGGIIVSDEEFKGAFDLAQSQSLPPSKR